MLRAKTVTTATGAALVLGLLLSLPAAAQAHGRGGFRVGVFVGGGFYGVGPYWAWGPWGWGPGYPPYGYGYYGASGGMMGYAMIAGFGALDLNVKPDSAEVWVDGKFVDEAKELDGDPSYLWLQRGPHHLVIYKGGYKRFEEDVEVQVARKTELKVRLEKGDSEPPGKRTAEPQRLERPRSAGGVSVAEAAPRSRERGELRLRVQPEDATVYVDGEFRGTGRELRTLHLSAGHHRIELVRPGFRSLEKELEVETGRSVELELVMERP